MPRPRAAPCWTSACTGWASRPRIDTLESLGDTVRLAASITDQRGTALIGTSLSWSSENPQMATVDSSGVAVAQAPGSTFIVAHVGEKSARSRLVVAPRMARLEIADTTVTIGEGFSRPLTSRALDARGHVAPPVPVTWVSSDTAVIVVNDSGVVTGVGAGEADVTVMHAGVLAIVHAIGVASAGAACCPSMATRSQQMQAGASGRRYGCCSSRVAAGRWRA